MTRPIVRDPIYRRRRFDAEIIELCVRWFITYRLSYRDLLAMMAERGIVVSHTTIHRWVIRYVPDLPSGGADIGTSDHRCHREHLTGGRRARPPTVTLRSRWRGNRVHDQRNKHRWRPLAESTIRPAAGQPGAALAMIARPAYHRAIRSRKGRYSVIPGSSAVSGVVSRHC